MRWRLLIEEFGPELHYIKGELNIVADVLSRLELKEEEFSLDAFALDEIEDDDYPLSYPHLVKMQEADKTLKARMQEMSSAPAGTDHGPYAIEERLHSDKKFNLLTKDGKICIPTSLHTKAAEWYHYHLCHPGETRLELTLRQHYDWKGLKGTVQKVCKGCTICAATKKKEKTSEETA